VPKAGPTAAKRIIRCGEMHRLWMGSGRALSKAADYGDEWRPGLHARFFSRRPKPPHGRWKANPSRPPANRCAPVRASVSASGPPIRRLGVRPPRQTPSPRVSMLATLSRCAELIFSRVNTRCPALALSRPWRRRPSRAGRTCRGRAALMPPGAHLLELAPGPAANTGGAGEPLALTRALIYDASPKGAIL
jgi:hypothetical protein